MESDMRCIRKKCEGWLVPDSTVVEGPVATVTGRCGDCKRSMKVDLDLDRTQDWIGEFKRLAFTCLECGERNMKMLDVKGDDESGHAMEVQCLECARKATRRFDRRGRELVEDVLPPREIVKKSCPSCMAYNEPLASTCGSCGREFSCGGCGARLDPRAKFCNSCGREAFLGTRQSVGTGGMSVKECWRCKAAIPHGGSFCISCGQQVQCLECNDVILPGLGACSTCGAPARKGSQ